MRDDPMNARGDAMKARGYSPADKYPRDALAQLFAQNSRFILKDAASTSLRAFVSLSAGERRIRA
jgi:hypothetical protein